MFYFSRGGARGGKDQFDWENVKADKYKEFYLGQTMKTQRATFNNPKPNAGWWSEDSEPGKAPKGNNKVSDGMFERQQINEEIARIKEQEEIMMKQELGLLPKGRTYEPELQRLDKVDIQQITRKGATDRDEFDTDRVSGLGFAPAFTHPNRNVNLLEGKVKLNEETVDSNYQDSGQIQYHSEEEFDDDNKSSKVKRSRKRTREERSVSRSLSPLPSKKPKKERKSKKEKKSKKENRKKEKKEKRSRDKRVHSDEDRKYENTWREKESRRERDRYKERDYSEREYREKDRNKYERNYDRDRYRDDRDRRRTPEREKDRNKYERNYDRKDRR